MKAIEKTKKTNKTLALKTAIKEGLDSGVVENFDSTKHLQHLKSQKQTTNNESN